MIRVKPNQISRCTLHICIHRKAHQWLIELTATIPFRLPRCGIYMPTFYLTQQVIIYSNYNNSKCRRHNLPGTSFDLCVFLVRYLSLKVVRWTRNAREVDRHEADLARSNHAIWEKDVNYSPDKSSVTLSRYVIAYASKQAGCNPVRNDPGSQLHKVLS